MQNDLHFSVYTLFCSNPSDKIGFQFVTWYFCINCKNTRGFPRDPTTNFLRKGLCPKHRFFVYRLRYRDYFMVGEYVRFLPTSISMNKSLYSYDKMREPLAYLWLHYWQRFVIWHLLTAVNNKAGSEACACKCVPFKIRLFWVKTWSFVLWMLFFIFLDKTWYITKHLFTEPSGL